jgi:hypothetical protein
MAIKRLVASGNNVTETTYSPKFAPVPGMKWLIQAVLGSVTAGTGTGTRSFAALYYPTGDFTGTQLISGSGTGSIGSQALYTTGYPQGYYAEIGYLGSVSFGYTVVAGDNFVAILVVDEKVDE